MSDSSQTDSDTCNSPSLSRAKAPVKNIPKFAIFSEEEKSASPKGLCYLIIFLSFSFFFFCCKYCGDYLSPELLKGLDFFYFLF